MMGALPRAAIERAQGAYSCISLGWEKTICLHHHSTFLLSRAHSEIELKAWSTGGGEECNEIFRKIWVCKDSLHSGGEKSITAPRKCMHFNNLLCDYLIFNIHSNQNHMDSCKNVCDFDHFGIHFSQITYILLRTQTVSNILKYRLSSLSKTLRRKVIKYSVN